MKTTTTKLFFSLAIGFLVFGLAQAGDLEPPGPPAPTLLKIPIKVAKTGQTGCWNASGTPISCLGSGMDGAYQAGVSVGPRFTNSNNGTVKDNLTGLIWLKNANCFGLQNWQFALSNANTLGSGACGLADGSAPGAWRLPNRKELESLIDLGHFSPALPAGHPFSGVQSDYWSSTSYAISPNIAWTVDLWVGLVTATDKGATRYLWPVRGGQ